MRDPDTLRRPATVCVCCINWVEKYPENLGTLIEEQEQMKQKALIVRMRKSHEEWRALKLDFMVV